MNKILYFLTGGLLLGGCSLTERTDLEVSPKPTLTVAYRCLNDRGVNVAHDEIEGMDVFVFDPAGRFLRRMEADRWTVTDPAGVRLLEGVPPGLYTVVAYANANRLVLPELVPGESVADDLIAAEHDRDTCPDADRLLHSLDRFEVRRGEPSVQRAELSRRYFRVELTITGAEHLGVSAERIAMLFTGIPAGVDCEGVPLDERTVFSPRLEATPQGFAASFGVYRFRPKDDVRMIVRAADGTVAQVDLGEYIARRIPEVDLKNDREVTLPIHIDITSAGIAVSIEDWNGQQVQLPVMGD